MSIFPGVNWGKTRASFFERGAVLPAEGPVKAALVFAFYGSQLVMADIQGRGWCIPGGHLHPEETPEEAARRETWEEIGGELGPLHFIGTYLLADTESQALQLVPTYIASVVALDALPAGTESLGRRLMTLEEAEHDYFQWDALIEAVFRHALAEAARTLDLEPPAFAFPESRNRSTSRFGG